MPALRALHEQYGDEDFTLIGVHTPEFPHERDAAGVQQAISDMGIPYPVVQDNDKLLWTGFRNRFWPAIYLVDRRGVIRDQHIGELHTDRPDWETLISQIETLLAEPVP